MHESIGGIENVVLVRPASRSGFKLRVGLSMAERAVRTLKLD